MEKMKEFWCFRLTIMNMLLREKGIQDVLRLEKT